MSEWKKDKEVSSDQVKAMDLNKYNNLLKSDINKVGQVGKTIKNECRTPHVMVTGSNQGEIPGHQYVGQSGECNAGSISGGIHPGGVNVYNNGPDKKGWWRVKRHRAG